jgi:hypothetical protein
MIMWRRMGGSIIGISKGVSFFIQIIQVKMSLDELIDYLLPNDQVSTPKSRE